MLFGEKLKQLRLASGLTQEAVAEKIGVTCRSYQNYEAGRRYPRQTEVYGKLALLFNVTADYLLTDEDQYLIDAHTKGGAKAMKDVQKLIAEVGGLFAGGELTQDDKDKVMIVLNDLYWKARQNNKEKYTPKKYRQMIDSNK
jgi:transcriptional regulator with XRE-family HTH domain